MGEAEQVRMRPAIALLILHRLVREVFGTAVHIPATHSVAETTAPATHRIHVFREVEQVRANAADLAQVCERMSLRRHITVRYHEREGEDRRIVLRRAAGIADFNDAVHGADTVGLDAADVLAQLNYGLIRQTAHIICAICGRGLAPKAAVAARRQS